MKLSAAIRIGSMTTKQITGRFTDGGNGRCALGAAVDAAGYNPHADSIDNVRMAHALFPELEEHVVHPEEEMTYSLYHAIWTLNDFYRWPREKIADWVETIENINLPQEQKSLVEVK